MSKPFGDLIERVGKRARSVAVERPLAKPASEALVLGVEQQVGFQLPPLLRQLYLEVADGGFGPGYGLLPLGNHELSDELTFVDVYRDWVSGEHLGEDWCWDQSLVPLCDWGSATYGCLDTSEEATAVYFFNWTAVSTNDDPEDYLVPTHSSLVDWFEDWLQGGSCYPD